MAKSPLHTPGISYTGEEQEMFSHLCDMSEDWSAPIHMDEVKKLGYSDRIADILARMEEACSQKGIPIVGTVVRPLSDESGADICLWSFEHMGKVRNLWLRVFDASGKKGQFVSIMGLPQDEVGRRYFPETIW